MKTFFFLLLFGSIAQAQQSALSYFNQAVQEQQANEAEPALNDYQHVIEMKSGLTPVAHYYRALILREIDLSAARFELSQIEPDKLPPNLRAKVEELSADLGHEFAPSARSSKLNSEKRVGAVLDLSAGSNSNPQTLAEISGATAATSVVSDTQTQAKVGLGVLAWKSDLHDLRATYFYSGVFFQRLPNVNYTSHDLTLPLAFYFDDFRLRISPEFYTDYYASQAFSSAAGGAVELTRRLGSSYLGLSLQANAIDNFNPSYSYLHGGNTRAVLSFQTEWSTSRAFATLAGGQWNYADTSTLGSSYSSGEITVGYAQVFQRFDAGVTLLGETRRYAVAAQDGYARVDLKWYADLQLGYSFGGGTRLYLDLNHTANSSNFSSDPQATFDPSYLQTTASVGLSYTY